MLSPVVRGLFPFGIVESMSSGRAASDGAENGLRDRDLLPVEDAVGSRARLRPRESLQLVGDGVGPSLSLDLAFIEVFTALNPLSQNFL